MPGLKLLNIDRDHSKNESPLDEIRQTMSDIESFVSQLSPNAQAIRMVPLRMKLRNLQDSVSQFGDDGSISVTDKANAIMQLHPELMMLTNDLMMLDPEFATYTEICLNFLLNHLCSSAASDPKSRVIGVSNVMAQVLSSNMQIITPPEFTIHPSDSKYFEEFSKIFNSMLTTAGLFAAPVLSLPDIPISALGGWADQALNQFAKINAFVKKYFDPEIFYTIDKKANATAFDTTTDILSFYVYENEFLSQLIARADLLSGLEFKILDENNPTQLTSIEDITKLLAQTIEGNCNQIEEYLDRIKSMYNEGKIDRNENPENHPQLMGYVLEAKIWRQIAGIGKLLVNIFNLLREGKLEDEIEKVKVHDSKNSDVPPLDDDESFLQGRLQKMVLDFGATLSEMFPSSTNDDISNFVSSSDFTKFKDFLQFIVILISANDVLLQRKNIWVHWLIRKYGQFLQRDAVNYNPIGTLQLGKLCITDGLISRDNDLIQHGVYLIKETKSHLEFQLHHLLSVEILLKLLDRPNLDYSVAALEIPDLIMNFVQEYEISPNSLLFQRSYLYVAMLEMYKESPDKKFLRKENERFVPFDLFSWLQVPKAQADFPYQPLNTSIDNLSSG